MARGSEYSEASYQNSTEEEESFELKVGEWLVVELRLLVEAVRRCCCTELYREPTFPFLSFNKAKQTKRDVFKSFFCLCFVSLLFFSFSLSDTERERRYRKWTSFV